MEQNGSTPNLSPAFCSCASTLQSVWAKVKVRSLSVHYRKLTNSSALSTLPQDGVRSMYSRNSNFFSSSQPFTCIPNISNNLATQSFVYYPVPPLSKTKLFLKFLLGKNLLITNSFHNFWSHTSGSVIRHLSWK